MSTNITSDMWEGHFNSDPTNFEEPPYHFFVTDHPYMATLGLSQFTTGTLYRWWNKKNAQGNNVNRQFFNDDSSDAPSIILFDGNSKFKFSAWRKSPHDPNTGTYNEQLLNDNGWNFSENADNEAGGRKSYTYADLEINEYDDCFLSINENLDLEKLKTFTIPDGKGATKDITFKGIKPITNVININDYVNHLEYDKPDRATWTRKDFARSELILDIQTSKIQGGGLGCIEWSVSVPFKISITDPDNGEIIKCDKEEVVNYKLFLYPYNTPRSSRRDLVIAKPVFAAPPKDLLGRKYQYREDGKLSAFPEGSQAAEIAAELSMVYNEVDGVWEGGTQQITAIISKEVTAAKIPSPDKILSTKPEDILQDPQNPANIVFGTGVAIPITAQNGNPQQQTATYVDYYDTDSGKFILCPEKSSRIYELTVYNHNTQPIERGTSVILARINGLWFVQSTDKDKKQEIIPGEFNGQWEFTYCATNFVHYFRDKDFKTVDYGQIEKAFHKKYYLDLNDSLNKNVFDNSLNGWNINKLQEGYCQFTSFDFMDNQIVGTRNNDNALGVTNPLVGPNGETVDSTANGQSTGAFFGCIFPDGYDANQIAVYRGNRNFSVLPRIAASGDDDSQYSFTLPDYHYFNNPGIPYNKLPFNDGQNRHDITDGFSVDGKQIPMFNNDDKRLTNLPADIATNASPFGDNGQPIRNIHYFNYLYLKDMYNIKNYNTIIKKSLNFLKKEYDNTEPGYELKNKLFLQHSAFDFKPVQPNHIMFRPLKAELYAHLIKDIDINNVSFPISNDDLKTRQAFSSMLAAYTKSKKRLISQTAVDRELNADIFWGNVGITYDGLTGKVYNLHNDIWGLQFNIDLPADLNYAVPKYHVSPNAAFNPGNNTERFHSNAWGLRQNLWCHGGNNANAATGLRPAWRSFTQEPAGAVGIIGAVATCTTNGSILFETNNKLGCWSWGDINALFNEQNPSWGRGNNYKDLNTTNLFVKIYHAWPREYTIYDPRYFAVHHFNPGIYDKYTGNNPEIKFEVQELIQLNSAGNSVKVKYLIDIESYNIDIRVPSAKQHFSVIDSIQNDPEIKIKPITLPGSTKTYADVVVGDVNNILDVLPQKKWNIDGKRRSKLLPYNFKFLSIVIPKLTVSLPAYNSEIYDNGGYAIMADGRAIPFLNSLSPPDYKTFDPLTNPGHDVVFIVKNPGTQYEANDTLTSTLGTDLEITVLEVDDQKRVSKFEITKPGYQFSNESFANAKNKITKDTTGILATNKSSEKGKDFKLYMVRGVVDEVYGLDEKPSIATNEECNLISIQSLSEDSKRVPGGTTNPFGLLSGSKKTNILIKNESKNKKYDLFFHFHNDISHTFKYPWAADFDARNNDEQYIDLTITTTT